MADTDISTVKLDRDTSERFQTLRRELGVQAFGINLMVLQPRQRGRVHRHKHQEEVYVVLEGELTLAVEGEEQRFGPDTVVRVPAQTRRQLLNRGSERVVLLALGGAGEHVGRDGLAWAGWDDGSDGRPPQEVPLPGDLPA